MPSSDPVTIPKVMQLVSYLSPHSILDVGCGNGRYGFLFREIMDLNHARMNKKTWATRIDAVEVDRDYITPVHEYVYNTVYPGDWLSADVGRYDLIFMGDVLEHFEDWRAALEKAIAKSETTLVVAPNWQGSTGQGAWHGHVHERHHVELTPTMLGGRTLYANSKCFITGFGQGVHGRDILL